MWDATCEHALRELRQEEEMGEATDWKDYIPVGGELLPPDEEQEVAVSPRLAWSDGAAVTSRWRASPGKGRRSGSTYRRPSRKADEFTSLH